MGALLSTQFQFGEYGKYNIGGTHFVLGSFGRHTVDGLFPISQLWKTFGDSFTIGPQIRSFLTCKHS